jgi:hypothetical protein
MAVFLGAWEHSLMAMFNAYFDASGAPDDCEAVVVAGFIAKAEQWIRFDKEWEKALADYHVTQLHMKHYAHSVGEYKSWKGDEYKRRRFLERLISLIRTRMAHSFACAVVMDGFREMDQRFCLSEQVKPYALAGLACVHKVREWAERSKIDHKTIAYVFEDGDKDQESLTTALRRNFRFIPIYQTKDECRLFEACDLLAYEHLHANRRIIKSGVGTLYFEEMRQPLQELDKVPHGNNGEDWGVYGADAIERHCVLNKYLLRENTAPTSVI